MTPVLCRVRERRQETEDTWTLELDAPPEPAGFAPGQFNMLYAFGTGEAAISISGDPGEDGRLVHTIRDVGAGTRALCRAQPGSLVGVRGPFGRPWPIAEAEGTDVVVVAGGIGLAPLRPVLYHLLARRERYGRALLLYGSRSPDLLLYPGELDAWRAGGALDVHVTVDTADRGWRGNVGVVGGLIDTAAFDPETAVAMVCGPEVMMRFAAASLRDRGIPAERIHLSMERNMHCGIGHCGHCQLGPTLVCRDGPVYPYSAIETWMAVREL